MLAQNKYFQSDTSINGLDTMMNVTANDDTIQIDIPDDNIVEDNQTASVLLSSRDPAIGVAMMNDQFLIVDNDSKL